MSSYPADGTVADVIAWIGNSRTRAAEARDAEAARAAQRKGVLEHIEATEQGPTIRFVHEDGATREVPANRVVTVERYERRPGWSRAQ